MLAELTERQTAEKVRAAGCESTAATAAQRLEALQNEPVSGQGLEGAGGRAGRHQNLPEQAGRKPDPAGKHQAGSEPEAVQPAKAAGGGGRRSRPAEPPVETSTQRLQLLTDLERNMNGYQHSVKTVMRAAQNHRLRGIIGPVSSILTVQPGYEVAIETALGFALQNIVVDGETAAKAAMAFLRNERAGRATFLPLDTVKGSHFDHPAFPAAPGWRPVWWNMTPKYNNIVANLLGRIIVVDEIEEASRVARALDYRNRIVTADGQVINAGGSFTGGSVSQLAGLFSRRQEIEDLRKKIGSLQNRQGQAQAAADKPQGRGGSPERPADRCLQRGHHRRRR